MKALRAALGLGIGRGDIAAYQALRDAQVAAVADVDEQMLEEVHPYSRHAMPFYPWTTTTSLVV